MHRKASRPSIRATIVVFALAMFAITGCATTRFHQRQKLNERCMQLDADGELTYLRNKVEAAREGSFGGYGAAAAGGCGCQ